MNWVGMCCIKQTAHSSIYHGIIGAEVTKPKPWMFLNYFRYNAGLVQDFFPWYVEISGIYVPNSVFHSCLTVILLWNHLMQLSDDDQTHEKFTFFFFLLYLFLGCVSVAHVEIVKVVMLSDAFLLSFKLLQETQLVIRMTQEFKDCSGIYLFFCDISFV